MNKKHSLKRVGETYFTNQGYEVEIIDGGSKTGYVKVKFKDKHKYEVEVSLSHLRIGKVRNPYHRGTYGVGFIGDGEYSPTINGKNTIAYTKWLSMLERAYYQPYKIKNLTYVGVTVGEKWHNFQEFAHWFYSYSNYVDGFHLDKDVLGDGKLYSEDTCCFLPREINSFFTNNKRISRNTSYVGVHYDNAKKKYIAYCGGYRIGQYEDEIEAHYAYEIYRTRKLMYLIKKHNIDGDIKKGLMKMVKPIPVTLDLDMTIFNTWKRFLEIAKEHYPSTVTHDDVNMIKEHGFKPCLDMNGDDIHEIFARDDFYIDGYMIEGFDELYNFLIENNYELNILTVGGAKNNYNKCKMLKKLGYDKLTVWTINFMGKSVKFDKGHFDCKGGLFVDDRIECLDSMDNAIKIRMSHNGACLSVDDNDKYLVVNDLHEILQYIKSNMYIEGLID